VVCKESIVRNERDPIRSDATCCIGKPDKNKRGRLKA
jgi:hypothetical protein